jgi:hypothetical protein
VHTREKQRLSRQQAKKAKKKSDALPTTEKGATPLRNFTASFQAEDNPLQPDAVV